MKSLLSLIRRFRHDDSGVVMIEAIMVLPFMLWAYLGLFVYWDSYRSINTSQKAAYTISDVLSRYQAQVPLPVNYVPGLRDLMRYLLDKDQSVKIRVTSVTWSQTNNRFEVDWSRSPDRAMPELTTATFQPLASRIPAMFAGTYVMLVETEVKYHPAFNVGVNDMVLKQFIVTRPRILPRICLTGVTCS